MPSFVAASVSDPIWARHLGAIEYAIERIYELGADDVIWLERFDEVRGLLARDDMTVKERLLAFGRLLEDWQAEMIRRRGN